MSDPATPAPQPARGIHWPRARLYFWATVLALALWPLGGAYLIRFHPKAFIDRAFDQFPYPATAGEVEWADSTTLVLRYVKFGDFFYADTIILSANVRDLVRHHVDQVIILDGDLFMSQFNKTLAQSKSKGKGLDWTINHFIIQRGLVMLDFGPQMPPVPVNVGARRPVILNHVHLGTPDQSKPMTEERVVELENIHFSSPFDPLAPVLSLPLVRLRFTYAELWHHHIRAIDLVRPNLYLGQDLFWFTDEIKKQRATQEKAGPGSPWEVGHFGVEYGRLSVNTFGQPRLNFPFFFDTEVNDIRLDQLDRITAKSAIAIRHFTRNYPEYKINVENLHGKIEFSVPPTDAHANNVVNTIQIASISWNDIPVTNAYVSATFDPTGIYVKLGGTCEKGQMQGNLEVYYTKGFLWNADLSAHQVDCAPIAEKLAGKYGSLTGTLNGNIAIVGQGTTIGKCNGTLSLDQPGVLRIQSADRLVDDLPAGTTALKRDALKIAVQAFAYYPYQTGQFVVNYSPAVGNAMLKLVGPSGKRNFEVYWHPFAGSEVAKDSDSH
jgi:hypothetical protein